MAIHSFIHSFIQSEKRGPYKTNTFFLDYSSVSPNKYIAKNLELFEPINLFFSTASTVRKLQ